MTNTGSLLLSVFIASSMSGWSGCFYVSVWQIGVCLIYSGLTQGQGHTVRHTGTKTCVRNDLTKIVVGKPCVTGSIQVCVGTTLPREKNIPLIYAEKAS